MNLVKYYTDRFLDTILEKRIGKDPLKYVATGPKGMPSNSAVSGLGFYKFIQKDKETDSEGKIASDKGLGDSVKFRNIKNMLMRAIVVDPQLYKDFTSILSKYIKPYTQVKQVKIHIEQLNKSIKKTQALVNSAQRSDINSKAGSGALNKHKGVLKYLEQEQDKYDKILIELYDEIISTADSATTEFIAFFNKAKNVFAENVQQIKPMIMKDISQLKLGFTADTDIIDVFKSLLTETDPFSKVLTHAKNTMMDQESRGDINYIWQGPVWRLYYDYGNAANWVKSNNLEGNPKQFYEKLFLPVTTSDSFRKYTNVNKSVKGEPALKEALRYIRNNLYDKAEEQINKSSLDIDSKDTLIYIIRDIEQGSKTEADLSRAILSITKNKNKTTNIDSIKQTIVSEIDKLGKRYEDSSEKQASLKKLKDKIQQFTTVDEVKTYVTQKGTQFFESNNEFVKSVGKLFKGLVNRIN